MAARLTAQLALIAIVALTLLSGCGGGDDEGSATTTAATGTDKSEYLKRVNTACLKARAGLDDRVAEFLTRTEQSLGEMPREVRLAELAQNVLMPTIEDEMEEVRAIPPPPGENGRINRLLYLEESALTRIVYMKRVPSSAAIVRPFLKSVRLLRDYGLSACAGGPRAVAEAV